MALITPERDRKTVEKDLEELSEILREMKDALNEAKKKIKTGEVATKKEVDDVLKETRGWIKLAHETEIEIARIRRKEDGIAGGYGIDIEAARSEIGCRLDRLRRCCQDQRVS